MVVKTYETENLKWLKDREAKSIDLIYCDPPFFTQKDWGEYDDRWVSLGDYLKFIKWRLIECHRVLKDTGSIYVHCDWRVNAHIRLMMDEVFGRDNFIKDIVLAFSIKQNSVMFLRETSLCITSRSITPNNLINKVIYPEYFIHHQPNVSINPPIAMNVYTPCIFQYPMTFN